MYQNTPDESAVRAAALRERAARAQEAAQVTAQADRLEAEHAKYIESLALRADLQLGSLLYKRRIKPGAMVATWSEVRGPHAGELSKADFRAFCVTLGLPETTTTDDIDAVFSMFDEDGGGYMDVNEAKDMIKGLLVLAEQAEQEGRAKQREARRVRAKASKLVAAALTEEKADEAPVAPQPLPPPLSKGKPAKAKAKKAVAAKHATAQKDADELRVDDDASDDGAEADDTTLAQRVEGIAAGFARRLQQMGMARAFTTWLEHWRATVYSLDQLRKITLRWMRPMLTYGLTRWIDVWEVAVIARLSWRLAERHSEAMRTSGAWGVWLSKHERARRHAQLVRDARVQAIARHPRPRRLASAVLNAWYNHTEQHRRQRNEGYWLRLWLAVANCYIHTCYATDPNVDYIARMRREKQQHLATQPSASLSTRNKDGRPSGTPA